MQLSNSNVWKLGVSINVIVLGIVSLFTDISSEIIYAVLPIFLVYQLGASVEFVGIIEGIAESISSFLKSFSGYISDKMGRRKPIILIGYGISNIFKPLMGFSTNWIDVLAIKSLDRIGKGLRTAPRDAIISESTVDSKIGRAFGIHRTLDQVGAVIGPFMAFPLIALLGYRGTFFFTALPGVIAIVILIIFLKEPKIKMADFHAKEFTFNKKFSIYLLTIATYSFGAISYAFIMLKAIEFGIPEEFAPLIYAEIQLFHVLAGVPAGEFSDKIGRTKAVQLGYLILLLSFLMLAFANSFIWIMFGALLFGIHKGFVETTQRAIIPSIVQKEYKATAYGIYNMVLGISVLPTNYIAGVLFSINSSLAFYYGSIFTIIAIILMQILQKIK
ncbi:MAG: MFS transporter [Candidatus Methanomethyliaceae archaeon]|nr:MFS transporter [Candidatus Methanomethyliaceae archaeon]MDW7970784.1 MFS transporter [Nitrososphaerota archaeon]